MSDTARTAQTIIDNSVARAQDEAKTQWSDLMLLNFMNKAIDYIDKLLVRINSEVGINDVTVSMIAGTQEYLLADNLPDFWAMQVNGVYFTTVEKPLIPVTYEDKIREGTTTTDTDPKSYYVTDTHLGVVNIPSATSVALYPTLNCRHYKQNTVLALTDNMPYKNIFNEPISTFSDTQAMMKADYTTAEYSTLFNTLEGSVLEVISKRVPI